MRNQQNVTQFIALIVCAIALAALLDNPSVLTGSGGDEQATFTAPQTTYPSGRPLSPYEQTAAQSLRETVHDLGNVLVALDAAGTTGFSYPVKLSRWSALITNNPKVLRLIEAGRDGRREEIRRWLEPEIAETIADMDDRLAAAKRTREQVRNDEVPEELWAKWSDPRPEPNYRYASPMYEHDRAQILVYNGFYVLAELGGMDRDMLADWFKAPKEGIYAAHLMDLWLVDRYYRQQPDAPGAERYLAGYGDLDLSARRVEVRTFSALGDNNTPAADRATLTLAGIPSDVPVDVDEAARIVREFVETTRGGE